MLPGFASKKKTARQLLVEAATRIHRQVGQTYQPARLTPINLPHLRLNQYKSQISPSDLALHDRDRFTRMQEQLSEARRKQIIDDAIRGLEPPDYVKESEEDLYLYKVYNRAAGLVRDKGWNEDYAFEKAMTETDQWFADEKEKRLRFWFQC